MMWGDIVIERVMDVALKSLTYIDPEDKLDCKIMEHEGGDEFRMMISADVNKCKILAQYIIDKICDIDFDAYCRWRSCVRNDWNSIDRQ